MDLLLRNNPERFPFYQRCRKAGLFCLFGLKEIILGNMKINPFEVPHDSHNTVGFSIINHAKKISIATDLGCAPSEVTEKFKDSDIIVIESNHDVEMEINSKRSRNVILRNLSDRGHLSNSQAKQAIERIASRSSKFPYYIFLAHISKECNTPPLAFNTMKELIERNCLSTKVELTYPSERSSYVEI